MLPWSNLLRLKLLDRRMIEVFENISPRRHYDRNWVWYLIVWKLIFSLLIVFYFFGFLCLHITTSVTSPRTVTNCRRTTNTVRIEIKEFMARMTFITYCSSPQFWLVRCEIPLWHGFLNSLQFTVDDSLLMKHVCARKRLYLSSWAYDIISRILGQHCWWLGPWLHACTRRFV